VRKGLFIISATVSLLAAGVGVFLLTHQAPKYTNGDISVREAQALPLDAKACAKPNDALRLTPQERNDIEMGAILHIVDVPAGTNVDVRIASADGRKASGSAIYPGSYGSYNFTVTKDRGPRRLRKLRHRRPRGQGPAPPLCRQSNLVTVPDASRSFSVWWPQLHSGS
jgi:hypothetical protein